jgi:hypothetical protein
MSTKKGFVFKHKTELEANGKKLPAWNMSGNVYPVVFDIASLEEVMKGQSEEKIRENVIGMMRKAFFEGLRAGHRKAGMKFAISLDQINDLADENRTAFREIWKFYESELQDYLGFVAEQDEKN